MTTVQPRALTSAIRDSCLINIQEHPTVRISPSARSNSSSNKSLNSSSINDQEVEKILSNQKASENSASFYIPRFDNLPLNINEEMSDSPSSIGD